MVSELTGARCKRGFSTDYPEVEGYVFSTEGGVKEKGVLWTNGAGVTRDLSFPVSALRIVEKEGDQSIVYDGEAGDLDGTANGRVKIRITGSPIYIAQYPEAQSFRGDDLW